MVKGCRDAREAFPGREEKKANSLEKKHLDSVTAKEKLWEDYVKSVIKALQRYIIKL